MTMLPKPADWFIDALAEPLKATSSGQTAFLAQGRRNNDFTSLAGHLRRKGFPEEDMIAYLLTLNNLAAHPLPTTEITQIAKSISRYRPGDDFSFDDTRLSQDLANCIRGEFCYTSELGWLRSTGSHWVQGAELQLQERIKSFAILLLETVRQAPDADTDMIKAAHRRLSLTSHKNLAATAASDPILLRIIADFDTRTDLLNLRNGTIEFGTGKVVFREHRAEDMLTQVADVDYDPVAKCPIFDEVLARALPPEEAVFLLRFIGYSLTATMEQQVFGIFHGPGVNGKSTLMNAVQELLGSYAVNVEPSSFMRQKHGNAIRNDLARLRGKRLAISSELGTGEILDAPLLKRFSGGDLITARLLYKENIEFPNTATPIFVTNARPVIDGGDSAMARRILLLSFDNVIPPEERDNQLPQKLAAERSGILNRLPEGLVDYLSDRSLRPPPSVVAASERYVAASDLLKGFLEDECIIAPEATVPAQELLWAYRMWCASNGVASLSGPVFKTEMEKRGFRQKKTKKNNLWVGLTHQIASS